MLQKAELYRHSLTLHPIEKDFRIECAGTFRTERMGEVRLGVILDKAFQHGPATARFPDFFAGRADWEQACQRFNPAQSFSKFANKMISLGIGFLADGDILNSSFVNDIVRSRKITEPGIILDLLDEGVTSTLRQDEDATTKDVMDIALC